MKCSTDLYQRALCLFVSLTLITWTSSAQQRAFNQNSSRSNHTRSMSEDNWSFSLAAGGSFGANSNEKTLFRGNSFASKFSGHYYFGTVGLGVVAGLAPGTINNNALNDFITERKYPAGQIDVNSAKPFNAFLMLGPSVRFGGRIEIQAGLQGGMFLNNPGAVSINQLGVTRALYRFDGGSKSLYPGFAGNIHIAYPLDESTSFFIHTDYLQSKTSIRLVDLQRGIDVPVEQERNVKLLNMGIGISKTLNSLSKRVLPTVNKREIIIPRDTQSGLATGKRILPTVNKREIAIDEPGVHFTDALMQGNNCGPVTVRKTFPDGTVEEKTFACPDDAAAYARQTQQSSFGEKVQSGLAQTGNALANGAARNKIIHRDLAARNILVGRISLTSGSNSGIVTNSSAAVSSVTNLGGGASTAAYARNGVATGAGAAAGAAAVVANLYTRESGSGMATGKRQYEPFFSEETQTNYSEKMGSVKSNPLYTDKGPKTNSPLYGSKTSLNTGGDNDCNGVEGITVYLIDAESNATVAVTKTESCGGFFFANVPSGNYMVRVSGSLQAKKGYDAYIKNKTDLAGELLAANDSWTIGLIADTGSVETAQAILKSKTKSNQSNDRTSSTSLVWSPRSNRTMNTGIGDLDGDGIPELLVGNKISDFGMSRKLKDYFETGDKPTQNQRLIGGALPGGAVISSALRPGNPIGGISVKGGKNPGGNIRTTQTNEFGEFEFTNLEEGNYTFTAELNYYISDETLVSLGDAVAENIVTSESNLKDKSLQAPKGDVKITASQNSQSLKTGINNINNGMPNRISTNFTVAKQTQGATFGEKVLIEADTDGDGEFETSFINYNGDVATISITDVAGAASEISITEPGTPKTQSKPVASTKKVVEKATSGLKDTLKTQVRMSGSGNSIGPVKWMAPEAIRTRVWGDPHVDEKTGSLLMGNTSAAKGKWRSAEVAIKTIKCPDGSCLIITAHPEDFPDAISSSVNNLLLGTGMGNAQVWFTDASGNNYQRATDASGRFGIGSLPPEKPLGMRINLAVSGDEDVIILIGNDESGKTVSNVLKTKHDTAKNSISNIR